MTKKTVKIGSLLYIDENNSLYREGINPRNV